MAVTSCSKVDQDVIDSGQSNVAKFSTSVSTRVVNDMWQDDDQIGVFMTQNQALVAANSNVKYTKSGADGASTSFAAAEGDILLPTTDADAGFFAYYPYTSAIQGAMIPVDLTDQSNPSAIDLLVASVEDNGGEVYNNRNSSIDLQFKHALSKLTINVTSGTGFSRSDLSGMRVSIDSRTQITNYNIETGALEPSQQMGTTTAYTAVDASKYEFILLPSQAVSGSSVIFEVNGSEYVWDVSSVALDQGVNHSYDVTINKTGVQINGASITPWSADTDSSDNSIDGSLMVSDIKLINGIYEIYSAKGLVALADLVNGNSNSSNATTAGQNLGFGSAKKYVAAKLMADIDLSEVCGPNIGNWSPIGNSQYAPFYGSTFDGNDKTISNLYIDIAADYQGLFGRATASVIYRLNISNSNIKGEYNIGALVGEANGCSISQCNVNASTIEGKTNVGGFIGVQTAANIFDSRTDNKTVVKGSDEAIGGISGSMHSSYTDYRVIEDCVNNASVVTTANEVGGITGLIIGMVKITNCSNTGSISGEDEIGGIVGTWWSRGEDPSRKASERIISGCNNYGYISGVSVVGGIAGSLSNSTIINCINHERSFGEVSVEAAGSGLNGAGGIAGDIGYYAEVTACLNKGYVYSGGRAGGIVGLNTQATIEACYNTGKVHTTKSYAGGIAGEMRTTGWPITDESDVRVIASYNHGAVSGSGYTSGYIEPSIGGIVGLSGNSEKNKIDVISCYNTGSVSSNVHKGPIIGDQNTNKITTKNNYYIAGADFGLDLSDLHRVGSIKELNTKIGDLNQDHDNYDYRAGANDNTPPYLVKK